jgi:hypothetical protein
MAWRDWGNPPHHDSTAGLSANPTTTTLLAELSTLSAGIYEARWIIGATTNASWSLELALSSGVTSTSFRDVLFALTPTNQSAMYVQTYVLEAGDRLRARLNSSFTGSAAAHLSVERLT